ncbi:unnamed protein product, partial [Mesorhabditis belari]|uniref:Uncharacterized protein n=1 Tax=Mesorhabditis belari TaxID=2138241 RepID=A0AAF3J777_9BILA
MCTNGGALFCAGHALHGGQLAKRIRSAETCPTASNNSNVATIFDARFLGTNTEDNSKGVSCFAIHAVVVFDSSRWLPTL